MFLVQSQRSLLFIQLVVKIELSAVIATTTTASANAAGLQVVYNACTVQAIVFASWIYSYQQQQQQQQKEQQ